MLTVPRSFADRNLHPDPIFPPTLTRDKSFPPQSLCPGWSPTWTPSAPSTLGSRARRSPGPAVQCRLPVPRCPSPSVVFLVSLATPGHVLYLLAHAALRDGADPHPVPSGTGVRAEGPQGHAAERWWGPCIAQCCAGLPLDATSSRRPSLTTFLKTEISPSPRILYSPSQLYFLP